MILETLVNELDYDVIGVNKNENGELIYDPNSFVLNSKNFGVPQNRPRVYIVGFRKDLKVDIEKYKLPQKRTDLTLYKDLNDLLEENVDDGYYIPVGYLETLKKHKQRHKNAGNGFGYIVVNKDKKDNIANAILATGGSGKERNIVYQPKEGVAGKIVKGKKTPLNSEGLRFMTPREWGKLQGFYNYAFLNEKGEETFSFPKSVSITQQYKLFGNSVTIPVVEEIAKLIKKIL